MVSEIYFIPGKDVNDDVKIVDNENNELSFSEFKKMIGDAYSYLNFNYPNELINEQIYDANILAFFRTDTCLFLSRTALGGIDGMNRHLPLTKIIINDGIEKEKIILLLNEGCEEYNFPKFNYRNKFEEFQGPVNKFYLDIQDWLKESNIAYSKLLDFAFSGAQRNGKSMIFNPIEKHRYDIYNFYSKKKAKTYLYLILAIVIIAVFIIFFL